MCLFIIKLFYSYFLGLVYFGRHRTLIYRRFIPVFIFESPIISLEKALRIKQKDVDDVEDNHENKNKNNGLLSTSL